jgi:hypothetical protein
VYARANTRELAIVIVTLVAIVSSTACRSQAVAERPTWNAGDAWRFKRTIEPQGASTLYWWTVVATLPDGGYSLGIGNRTERRDANLEVVPEAGPEYKMQWQRWPLRVGDRWSYEIPVKLDAGNGSQVTQREVVGAEKVTVDAGSFDCLRIESQTTRMTYNAMMASRPNYSSTWERTDWYCPSIRQVAKTAEIWRDGYGNTSRTEWVLVNYHLVE